MIHIYDKTCGICDQKLKKHSWTPNTPSFLFLINFDQNSFKSLVCFTKIPLPNTKFWKLCIFMKASESFLAWRVQPLNLLLLLLTETPSKNSPLFKNYQLFHYYLNLFNNKPEASPGFFGGGTPRPLKGYHAPPPQGVRGRRPPDGSEVSFFKTIQSIIKWIHFSKISTFFLPEISIFSKKNFENLNIFYKNFWIFSKNYFKIFSFYDTL